MFWKTYVLREEDYYPEDEQEYDPDQEVDYYDEEPEEAPTSSSQPFNPFADPENSEA